MTGRQSDIGVICLILVTALVVLLNLYLNPDMFSEDWSRINFCGRCGAINPGTHMNDAGTLEQCNSCGGDERW